MKKILLVLLIMIVLVGLGLFIFRFLKPPLSTSQPKSETTEQWQEEGVRISGNYADADIVALDDGRYRLYFAAEPEIENFQGQIYSALSSDGLIWQIEEGVRMLNATFPSVIRLNDGRWRMYYQGTLSGSSPTTAIVSAMSTDGLTWTQEDGSRIKIGQQGEFDSTNVADPTVIQLKSGKYLMVYRGSAGENSFGKRDEKANKPSPIDYLISAISDDGLKWTPQTVVIDSRNEEMREQILGDELVLDGQTIKLYSNSYAGVYLSQINEQGQKISEPQIIIKSTGPEYAPSDPTVIKMPDAWRMYFGLHTKGIYSAIKK